MEETLYLELKKEIITFKEQTERFLRKELNVKEFKGYSGGFGSYAQRGASTFMLRLRMNQGIITKDRLDFLCDICRRYPITKAHFTTCQTIQLHDLKGSVVPSIMEEALDHGIVCRGGGGDFPRNVMCSPLSGVDPLEAFDVRPYAQATGDYLLSIINKYSLPRKLKIAFSNSSLNETHATFRDMGFVANDDHTFDIYCAGGLGSNPKMGVKVGSHVDPSKILYYVSSMVLMFMEHGNYENRAKARTRYMQETLTPQGLEKDFRQKVMLALQGQQHDLQITPELISKQGDDQSITHPRILKQKQQGLYAVSYHPIGGTMTPTKLFELQEAISTMEQVELRITPQQGLYIINCTAQEAEKLLTLTEDGAQNTFETSVACIGASTCQVGLRDSQGVLQGLIETLRPKHYADHVLPRIYISGCPSSCGTNQIGALGFQGSVKVIDKVAYPAFVLSIHGNALAQQEMFGEQAGVILEQDIAPMLMALADQITLAAMTYETWTAQHPEQFKQLVQSYIK